MSKYLTKKRKSRRRKTRRVKKGGFLFNQDLKFAGIDLSSAVKTKLKENSVKYPVEKSKGNAKKYNELG